MGIAAENFKSADWREPVTQKLPICPPAMRWTRAIQ